MKPSLQPTAMTAAPEEAVPVAAGTAALEGTAQSAGNRWVAEAVSLSPAEAAVSLEAEMFRTLAPPSITTPAPVVAEEMAPSPGFRGGFAGGSCRRDCSRPVRRKLRRWQPAQRPRRAERIRKTRGSRLRKRRRSRATATFALQYAEAEAASAVESSMPATRRDARGPGSGTSGAPGKSGIEFRSCGGRRGIHG